MEPVIRGLRMHLIREPKWNPVDPILMFFFSLLVSWIKEERATDIFPGVTSTDFIIGPFFLIKIDKGHN